MSSESGSEAKAPEKKPSILARIERHIQRRMLDGLMDLLPLLRMSESEFAERFAGSPIRRAKYEGLLRNACVALGNIGDERAIPALAGALRHDSSLVRGHAAWALGAIGGAQAEAALRDALAAEPDADVREEIAAALEAEAGRATPPLSWEC